MPKRNPNKLMISWSEREQDFMVAYPRRCDGAMIQGRFFNSEMIFDLIKYNTQKSIHDLPYKNNKSIIDELKERGYDMKTMKFSIELSEPIH